MDDQTSSFTGLTISDSPEGDCKRQEASNWRIEYAVHLHLIINIVLLTGMP